MALAVPAAIIAAADAHIKSAGWLCSQLAAANKDTAGGCQCAEGDATSSQSKYRLHHMPVMTGRIGIDTPSELRV